MVQETVALEPKRTSRDNPEYNTLALDAAGVGGILREFAIPWRDQHLHRPGPAR